MAERRSSLVRSGVYGKLLRKKYPLVMASCHDLITDGTVPTGRSFSLPESMAAGAEPGDGDPGRGFHGAKPGDDHLVVNLGAVLAAVFGYFEEEGWDGLHVHAGKLAHIADEALYQRFGSR